MTRQFQRRTILIKRSLQLRYMALVLIAALAAALIVGAGIYLTLANYMLFDPRFEPELAKVNHRILVQLIMYFGIITILASVISHRIAGPLYRFEQSARAFGQGDLTHRVALRTGDELGEIQEAFNEMAVSLQTKVQKDRHLARRIQTKLDELGRRADGGLKGDLEALKEEVGHLTQEFKV